MQGERSWVANMSVSSLYSAFGKEEEKLDVKLDVSHLCHNRSCWRPSHLTAESHVTNMARSAKGGCGGTAVDVTKNEYNLLCTHEPVCMVVRVISSPWTPL